MVKEAQTDRKAVNARADAAARSITGAPHGNRRRQILIGIYVLTLVVLLVLNSPLA